MMTRTLVLHFDGLIYGPAKARFSQDDVLPVFVFHSSNGKRRFVLAHEEFWHWIEAESGPTVAADVRPEECDPVLTAVALRTACIEAGFQLSATVMLDSSSVFQIASVELCWSEEWRARLVTDNEFLAVAGYDPEEDELTLARVRGGEVQAYYRAGFECDSDFSLTGPPPASGIEDEAVLIARFETLFGWAGQIRGRSELEENVPSVEYPDDLPSPMTWALRRAVTCGLAFLGGRDVDLHLRVGALKFGNSVLESRIVLFQPGRSGPGKALILVFPSVGAMFGWIGARRPETFHNVYATVAFDGKPPLDFIRHVLATGHRVRVLFRDDVTLRELVVFRSVNLAVVNAELYDHVEDQEVETPEAVGTRIGQGGAQ